MLDLVVWFFFVFLKKENKIRVVWGGRRGRERGELLIINYYQLMTVLWYLLFNRSQVRFPVTLCSFVSCESLLFLSRPWFGRSFARSRAFMVLCMRIGERNSRRRRTRRSSAAAAVVAAVGLCGILRGAGRRCLVQVASEVATRSHGRNRSAVKLLLLNAVSSVRCVIFLLTLREEFLRFCSGPEQRERENFLVLFCVEV